MTTSEDQANERPCPFARLDAKSEDLCARFERELCKSTLAIVGTVIGTAIVTAMAVVLAVGEPGRDLPPASPDLVDLLFLASAALSIVATVGGLHEDWWPFVIGATLGLVVLMFIVAVAHA
jgi:hypothetical protein